MQILDTLGVDFLVVIEFSREFASGEARVFADELLGSGVRRLAAGEDWNFGKGRKGNMKHLAEWGDEVGVAVYAVSAVMQKGERISSTRIRQALRDENLVAAEEMLGRPYSVMGEVVQGRQLGRQLGFRLCQLLGLWLSASNVVDVWDQVMKTWTLVSNCHMLESDDVCLPATCMPRAV